MSPARTPVEVPVSRGPSLGAGDGGDGAVPDATSSAAIPA